MNPILRQVLNTLRSKYIQVLLLGCMIGLFPALVWAQQTNLDWKMHDVGKIRQVNTNMGAIWKAQTNYPGLIYSEFPPGSGEEHVGEGGFWIGAITEEQDTLVSVSDSWNSPFEFYPTAEPYDTIWVANKNDTLDIPYWPNYIGQSDQDFVSRYNDYGPASQQVNAHNPLYLDVIETSYAYSSAPLDEMIIYTIRVIPQKHDLNKAYIAYFLDGNVGYRGQGWGFALDDYSVYKEDRHLGIAMDNPGGEDGTAISPIGVQLFPPENIPEDQLKWTFNWYPGQGLGGPPSRDPERYSQMAEGVIMRDQENPIGSQFMVSFGPVNVAQGDTLTFRVAQLQGEGEEGLMRNSDLAQFLIKNNFKVPSPPPTPSYTVTTKNREVSINWEPEPGRYNPETYVDSNRVTNIGKPFEGYRIYKSTQSSTGPWTLLAEYDVGSDNYGNNTGLKYEYKDTGLLNNIEYFYTVTAFSKPDSVLNWPSLESSVNSNARTVVPGTEPPKEVGEVAVVPNPYRGDINYNETNPAWEKPPESRERWLEQDRRIQFINLPQKCTIKIFTVSGTLVQTLNHNSVDRGYEDWNLTSSVGQAISSGIYLFTVENKDGGEVQVGKFVVIK